VITPVVFEVQRFIDQHFAEPLTINDLTSRFYLSASYLSHAFKLWTGYSPQRYLMLCRLSYARELLLTTRRSVSEITLRCGFRDESNFIRSFKKECGLSPNRYRREHL
jgi:transcriptional regulator GlxA family with amidase domain